MSSFDQYLEQRKKELQPSLTQDTYNIVNDTSTPEQEAEISGIQKETGLPDSIIRENIPAAQNRSDYQRIKRELDGAPSTSNFVKTGRHFAAVRDDIPALANVEKTVLGELFEDAPAAWRRGEDIVERGRLYSELGNAMLMDTDTTEIQAGIKDFESREEMTPHKGGWIESATEMLPMRFQHLIAGHSEGMKYAMVGAAGALALGTAGVATLPLVAATGAMYAAGTRIRLADEIFTTERGNALSEFLVMTDEEGETLDPAVANVASLAVGGINAGLEFVGLKAMLGTIPGGEMLLGRFITDSVKTALKNPGVRMALTKVAMRYAKGVTVEVATEIAQETVNVLAGEIAKAPGEFLTKELGEVLTPESLNRIWGAGEMAAKATILLLAPGSSVKAVNSVRRSRAEASNAEQFDSQQRTLRDNIEAARISETNPDMMQQFLDEHLNMQGQDAFVDSDTILTLAQESPEIFDELTTILNGNDSEILTAANQGRDMRIGLSTFHTQLSQEAKDAVFDGLKAAPGAYSVKQVQEGLAQTDAQFEEKYKAFATETEAIRMESSRIEREALDAGMDVSVAQQTAQIAERNARSLAGRSENQSASEILKKLNFDRGQVQIDGGTQYDQQEIYYRGDVEGAALNYGKQPKGNQLPFGVHFTLDKGIAEDFASGMTKGLPTGTKGKILSANIKTDKLLDVRKGIYEEGTEQFKILKEIADASPSKFKKKGLDPVEHYDKELYSAVLKATDKTIKIIDPNYVLDRANIGAIKKVLKKHGLDEVILYSMRGARDSLGMGMPEYTDAVAVLSPKYVKEITDDGMQYNQQGRLITDNENFRKWFGKSPVVDESRQPLVVYHGTGAQFDAFDFGKAGSATEAESARGAFFFTPDEPTARAYSVYAAEDAPVQKLLKKADEAEERGDWAEYDRLLSEAEGLDTQAAQSELRKNAKVLPVYLAGDNFLEVDAKGKTPQELSDEGDTDSWLVEKISEGKAGGHDGVIFRNLDDAVGLYDRPADHYAVFSPTQIKSVYNEGTYDPKNPNILKQTAKGTVKIFDDRYIISLLENADASTPFHELAHVYYNEMANIVNQGAATQELQQDFDTLNNWLAGLDDVQKQEKFARGFEAYLMTGKAPQAELVPVFKRFARWFKEIYKHVRNLDVKLTPEVREVYDRMLIVEEQIDDAIEIAGLEPLTLQEMDVMGVLPEDREYLAKLHEDAQAEAERKLLAARKKGVRDNIPKWAEEAKDAIQRNPLYDTVNRLKKGQGIDRQTVLEIWGQEAIDRMPKGLKKIFKKDGMLPDEVAYEENFQSAEQLFDALEGFIPEKEFIKNYIAGQKAAFENSLNPSDFIFDTKAFADYLDVLSNYTSGKMDQQAQLDAALSGKNKNPRASESHTPLARTAFKNYAKKLLRTYALRDALRADLFMSSVKKASQAEKAAIKKQDWEAAQKANEQMRLNFELARESRKLSSIVDKIQRAANRLKKGKPAKVDAEYLGAALRLAERFKLIKTGSKHVEILQKAGDIKTLLNDSTDLMGADDFGFSSFLTDSQETTDYRDMTIDELQEVRTLFDTLMKKGRERITPFLSSIGKDLLTVKEEVLGTLDTLQDKPVWKKQGDAFFGIDPTAALRKLQDKKRKAYADTYQLWAMIRILDGFTYYTDGTPGPFEVYFRDNLERAYTKKASDTHKYEPKIRKAFSDLFKLGIDLKLSYFRENITTPAPDTLTKDGRQWDYEAVITVALNMGNASNLQRLTDGYGWTKEHLIDITSILGDEQWDSIQEIWDIFEEMRPEFFAASERIHGIPPPLIEPAPFTLPSGQVMRGGYVPAVYDPQSQKASELEMGQQSKRVENNGFQRPVVNSRATKSRAKTAGGMPIRLNLSGIAEQFEYNLHYTAFAETIRDLTRLISNQEIIDKISDKVGREWLPTMRVVLDNVASPGVTGTANYITSTLQRIGNVATKYALGLNRSVSVKQTLSMPAIYVEDGSWHRGVRQVIRNPVQALENMYEDSPSMRERMQGRKVERELAKERNKLIARHNLKGDLAEIVDAIVYLGITVFDALTVVPSWYGTKQKMERKYGPGQRAIEATNKVIFDTQPMTREMDLSVAQLDRRALSKMITFFTTALMKFENRKRIFSVGRKIIPLNKVIKHIILERIVPPLLINLAFTLGAGDDLEPDEIAWEILLYQVCGFPVVRELSVAVANAVRWGYQDDFRGFSAFGTPLMIPVQAFEWNMYTLAKWYKGDEENQEAVLAMIDIVLGYFGVPAVKFAKDLEESARQFEKADGFESWFKLLVKPNPEERE